MCVLLFKFCKKKKKERPKKQSVVFISPHAALQCDLTGNPTLSRKCGGRRPHLASVALGCLEAAAAQAAVGRGTAAADDLQLLLGAVRAVQQLLDELLQPHFGVGLARCRLLEELVNLGDFPGGQKRRAAVLMIGRS